MNDESIVILSSDDWGWKTSKYQLSVRFSRRNRVLFVSSIGFRPPTASRSDAGRMLRKLAAFFRGPRKVQDNVWVLTPLVVPFGRGRAVRGLNRLLFRLQYAAALRILRLRSPYLFVFSPNWRAYVPGLRRRKLIYYCVDEQSGFKGVDGDLFRKWDEDLTRQADHVFCSAHALWSSKQKLNPATHYMPHGVNWRHFAGAVTGEGTRPIPELEGIDGPILLFFGHISYDWVDTELVRWLAGQRPEWHIVLAGRSAVDEAEFAACPNVHLLGEREYDELPSLCASASVGIIPFVESPLTAACNPLKLYEYLAAGLPVVSTEIPEVRRAPGAARVAATPAAFLRACEDALRIDRRKYGPEASASVREHDWDRRVEKIYSLVAASP